MSKRHKLTITLLHTPTPFVVLVEPSDMMIIGERSRGAQNLENCFAASWLSIMGKTEIPEKVCFCSSLTRLLLHAAWCSCCCCCKMRSRTGNSITMMRWRQCLMRMMGLMLILMALVMWSTTATSTFSDSRSLLLSLHHRPCDAGCRADPTSGRHPPDDRTSLIPLPGPSDHDHNQWATISGAWRTWYPRPRHPSPHRTHSSDHQLVDAVTRSEFPPFSCLTGWYSLSWCAGSHEKGSSFGSWCRKTSVPDEDESDSSDGSDDLVYYNYRRGRRERDATKTRDRW